MKRMDRQKVVAGVTLWCVMAVMGCGPRGDVIEVKVCGDVGVPGSIDAVRVSVLDASRVELRAGTRELLLCPEDRLLALPQTISFEGVNSVDAWVVVQGLKDGVEVLSYERRATLSTDVIEQVTMVVDASCVGVRCVLGQTCIRGECEIVSDQAPAGACDSAAVIVIDPEQPAPEEDPVEEEQPEEMQGPMYCPAPPMMQEETDA